MTGRLSGRRVVVTGGARGIGAAIVATRTALFLASADSDHLTGDALDVSGGMLTH